MGKIYNIVIDLIGIILIFVLLTSGKNQKYGKNSMINRILNNLMFCLMVIFMTDIFGLLLDGTTFQYSRSLLWIADITYWIFQIVYCWLWVIFADYWAFGNTKQIGKKRLIYAIPMLIELILIIITPLNGWVFILDDNNTYARGSLFFPNMIPYVLYIIVALVIMVKGYFSCNDQDEKRRKISFITYMSLPVCGVLFDTFVYGVSWIWPLTAISLLLIYLNVQQQFIEDEKLNAAKLRAELAESRMTIMLSQIQPHFLYNALLVIQNLCHGKAPDAEQATIEFSQFLRSNLDSLTVEKPIPFKQELNHVKNYLRLEGYRFGNRLQVEYDIETEDFQIPALTVQPIVENAVRYGIMKREDGGTIWIATRELSSEYQITVKDANMKTTPCVYYGSIKNRDLVVVGHNYDSQFGELNHAGEGIKVRISLIDGTSYEYISTQAEYYNPDCVDEVLTGNWDLTLLTCNYAGDKRIALRCNIVK